MKRDSIKWVFIVLATACLTSWPVSPIQASIVLDIQRYDGSSPGTASQIWTDNTFTYPKAPSFDTKAFDDVTVPIGVTWLISGVTIFGREQEFSPQTTKNVSVNLQFASSPNYNDPAPVYSSGSEDPNTGNLIFTFSNSIALTSGTHWISSWVDRLGYTYGQWDWLETTPVIGGEYYTQNPGGGINFGITTAIPGSTIDPNHKPHDLAFEIDGLAVPAPVPAPSSWYLLAIGVLSLAFASRVRGPRADLFGFPSKSSPRPSAVSAARASPFAR